MIKSTKPSYLNFDKKNYPWKNTIDYKKNPDLYKVGRGEQGVLICEPYKSQIVRHWRFKTPEIATKSSQKILSMFNAYLTKNDFVGADLARKFLQMGYTRAKRYANYKGGKKYDKDNDYRLLPKGSGEVSKNESAEIFYKTWKIAEENPKYIKLKKAWREKHG